MDQKYQADQLTIQQIRQLIVNFNQDKNAQKLIRFYRGKSLPELLGVNRREVSHSRFISWLLSPDESHGLGDFFLHRFFELVITGSIGGLRHIDQAVLDNLLTRNYTISSVSVQLEKVIPGGRIDIFIEAAITTPEGSVPLRMVIENKTISKEQNDQTQHYYNHFEGLNDPFNTIYIYLTPMPTLDLIELSEPECVCKAYCQINYQGILDQVIEPAMNSMITDDTRHILSQYILSLSQPSLGIDDEGFEKGLIMAIGTAERELLNKFWDGNEQLIMAALYAISSDPSQDKDIRDSISSALSTIGKADKDKRNLTVYYNGVPESVNILKADIGLCIVKLIQKKGLLNQQSIEWLKSDRSANSNLIKTLPEISQSEKQYRKYRFKQAPELFFDQEEYYVVRNWGINNVIRFIERVQTEFPKISIKINDE